MSEPEQEEVAWPEPRPDPDEEPTEPWARSGDDVIESLSDDDE
jgi:hypothetical protein